MGKNSKCVLFAFKLVRGKVSRAVCHSKRAL